MSKNNDLISGVCIRPLKRIPDERGAIYHMMKSDDSYFEKFGEVYGSWIHRGAIKGWHLHQEMTLNYLVPVGKIKLVLYDSRNGSMTKGNLMEIFLGEENYSLVTIPPKIWNGHKGIGCKNSLDSFMINVSTHPHDPTGKEMLRLDPLSNKIPYDWEIKNK